MKHPQTVYRGARIYDKQVSVGVRVTVDGEVFSPRRSRLVKDISQNFEWSYSGAGPMQLALALVLDATDDRDLAELIYPYFRYVVMCWPSEGWSITAGEIQTWVEQAERETILEAFDAADGPVMGCFAVPHCRVCGCTEDDCSQCIEASGMPCCWMEDEDPPICSRCAIEDVEALIRGEGGAA
jgi:hypothetical protein